MQFEIARLRECAEVLPEYQDWCEAINEGDTVSREFMRITFTGVPAAERAQVKRQLEAYCTDTQAPIDILFALQRL